MKSKIYEGFLRHRRHTPRSNKFTYQVAMFYLRLDEIDELCAASWLWSSRRRALGEFRRSDFLGDPQQPLESAVRGRILQETGQQHSGPIYLLANLRCFGLIMNPIACYYCFNEDETRLEYIVAEVNNTPWDERHSYVLTAPADAEILKVEFDKAFHVSPFNPMEMRYHWCSNTPHKQLLLHLENRQQGERVFDATLSLAGRELSPKQLDLALLRYPLMSAKVALAIYWQALKLAIKRVPFFAHPAASS
jgi:hypothetical protein